MLFNRGSSSSLASRRAVIVLAFAVLTTACVKRADVSGVAHPAELSVRKDIPASAKFVLRKPTSTGRVSEGPLNPAWGRFEVGLFASGLAMVDSALLEQLLRSGAAASYEQIHAQTGADVVIEVIDLAIKNREVEAKGISRSVYCQSEEMTIKLVDVAAGSMMGTVVIGRSSCPQLVSIRDTGSMMYFIRSDGTEIDPDDWDFVNGTAVIKLGTRPPGEDYWEQLGKRVGALIQEKQVNVPVAAPPSPTTPAAPVTPPAGERAGSGYLGIGADAVPAETRDALGLADGEGVVVVALGAGGPAEKAGLRKGDVLLLIDGVRVTSSGFVQQVGTLGSGKTVKIVLSRGNQRQTISVTTTSPPVML